MDIDGKYVADVDSIVVRHDLRLTKVFDCTLCRVSSLSSPMLLVDSNIVDFRACLFVAHPLISLI